MDFNSNRFKLVYMDDSKISAALLNRAAKFADVFDEKICFAAIGKNHFLVVEYDGNPDENALLEKFRSVAEYVLYSPPDFETMVLDNGLGLVITAGNLFSVIDKKKLSLEDRRIPIDVAIKSRDAALKICNKFNVIAIGIPKSYAK